MALLSFLATINPPRRRMYTAILPSAEGGNVPRVIISTRYEHGRSTRCR